MFKIVGAIKDYHWGTGPENYTKLMKLCLDDVSRIDGHQSGKIAEYWLGTHKSGRLRVVNNQIASSKPIADLPFLLKVLSVEKPLSIQLHPDRNLADRLHKQKPLLYPDSNHKPELVIALTEFPILCNFRPVSEVLEILEHCEPLKKLLIDDQTNLESTTTVSLFKKLLQKSKEEVILTIDAITQTNSLHEPLAKYFSFLNAEYPYDVGVLMVFLLQIHELKPMEAMFVPAMVPHAYLGGGCEAIEIMANSDNVIRVGLTPKPKDLETILDWNDYHTDNTGKFVPCEVGDYLSVYEIDGIKDFGLGKYRNSDRGSDLKTCSASIIFIASGKVRMIVEGQKEINGLNGEAFYVFPNTNVHLCPSNSEFIIFHAYSLMNE